jgi:hypothetical protein
MEDATGKGIGDAGKKRQRGMESCRNRPVGMLSNSMVYF